MKKYLLLARRSLGIGGFISFFFFHPFARRSFNSFAKAMAIKSAGGFMLILLLPFSSFSQGVWTWMKGDTISSPVSVYGTQGVPAAANAPEAVYGPASWTDLQGNFWLFGGQNNASSEYGDLWEYNITTNNWTWIKGNAVSADVGNYGTQGVPAINNLPPARKWGAATWVDLNGDLWMYGGSAAAAFNDLWRYNIATNTWTWMQGSSSTGLDAVYGTRGVPSPTNTPGGRWECTATWIDSTGNFWLFGGNGGLVSSNDLWKYDISLNQWIWMKGSDKGTQSGVYGTPGVPDTSNTPSSRAAYCSWKDLNGKFWLFGGRDEILGEPLNDMWMYNPDNNEWTWMGGTNQASNGGNYGALCSSSVNYVPAGRFENRARWTDDCGKFWMYGGFSNGDDGYNDLWNFDPITLKWTLASGGFSTNLAAVHGIQGLPAAGNQPGGRGGAIAWRGNDGNLYLFGGINDGFTNYLGDLWRFKPDASCPAGAGGAFSLGNDTSYCSPFSRVLSTNNANTLWSTGATASQITVTTPGKYWATLNSACGVESDTIVLSQGPPPVVGAITRGRDSICQGSGITSTIRSGNGSGNLQWQSSTNGIDFTDIPNATTPDYITPPLLSQNTWYRLIASSGSCGADTSNAVIVYIVPAPVAVFKDAVNGRQVTFNSSGTSSNVISWAWDFGDSTTSSAVNPVHNYAGTADSFYVCLTVYNNSNCSYTLCQYINLLNTGIANISADNFIHLYPNPANNTINLSVDGLTGNYDLKIYNVLGQNVGGIHESPLYNNETIPIDLSTLAQGEYELVLVNDKEYYSKRFVKVK